MKTPAKTHNMSLPQLSLTMQQQPPRAVTRAEPIDPPVVVRMKLHQDDAARLLAQPIWATASLAPVAGGCGDGLRGTVARAVDVEAESGGRYAVFDFTFGSLRVLPKGGFRLRVTVENLFCVDNASPGQRPYVESARFEVFD